VKNGILLHSIRKEMHYTFFMIVIGLLFGCVNSLRKKIRIAIPRGILSGLVEGDPRFELGSEDDAYSKTIRELEVAKEPDTELVFIDVPDAIGPHVMQEHESDLVGVTYAREALKAEEAGFDGVYPTCFAEPGVVAARELCTIPVMSSTCAAFHLASMLGDKFSLIFIGKNNSKFMIMNRLRRYGLEGRLASIRALDKPPTGINPKHLSPEEYRKVQEEMLDLAKKAIEEDGADVILAYGCYEYLRDNLNVPVVHVRIAGLKMIEAIIRMGLSFSKKTYPRPTHIHRYYLSKEEP
jgi:allantoin racemase